MVVGLGKHLVAGGFFGVRGQPVVFQGVTGDAGDVLHRQVKYGMFGDRSVPVAQHPAFVEVRRLFLSDLLGDFIEGFRPAGGHGEGDGDLLLCQLAGVQRIDPAGIAVSTSINCTRSAETAFSSARVSSATVVTRVPSIP